MPLSGLPAKKLVVFYATFRALVRSPFCAKSGPPADLAQVGHWKSDMRHCCFGGLSRRVHGSGQPKRRWVGSSAVLPEAYAGPHLQPGGARLSVCPGICEQAGSLRVYHSWGPSRIRQLERHNPRVKSVGLRPLAAFWRPSLGCPLGRSLPRLPMGWRGLARGLRASPPMVVRPGSTQLSGFEVRFLVSGPRGRGVRPSCCGDSASR